MGSQKVVREELAGTLKWVSLFRITAITVILGIGIYFIRKSPYPFSVIPLWFIIGITYLLTFIYWRFLRTGRRVNLILWTTVIIDAFIMSVVVYYTGGSESLFGFLFLFPIVEASIFFFLKGSAVTATVCLGIYGAILWLEFRNLIPSIFLGSTINVWDLWTILYLRATFFYLVALTSGYLAERVRQKGEALEQVKLDTSTILHSIKSGLIVLDYDGAVLYKNKVAEKILSLPIKENINLLSPPIREIIGKLYNEGFQEIMLGPKIIRVHTYKLQDTKGEDRGVVLVLDDITDSIITERLATIGKFSGDLAHEVRNPLTAIHGACELIKEGVKKHEMKKLVNNILVHTRRLNDIVTNFLSFARSMPLKLEEAEIGEIINEAIALSPNKIPLEVIQDTPLRLKIDKEQMRTAFLNLIINASEAMEGNGKLQITATRDRYFIFDEKREVEAGEIVICFKDTGKGITDSEIPQIFTPFYTTKNKGVGLGLSIVSKIIETHKGRIEVKSRLGEGTVFAIHLPYK